MSRLPVRATARETYRYIRQNLGLLAAPALLLFAVEYTGDWLMKDRMDLQYLWMIAENIIDSSFVVGLYRAAITGEKRGMLAFFPWNRPLWRYLLTGVKLSMLLVILAMLLIWAAHGYLAALHSRPIWQAALLLALILPPAYLCLRMSLAFPAATIGEERLFRLSWRLMRGNSGRMLVVALLTQIPVLIAALLLLIGVALISIGHASWQSPLNSALGDLTEMVSTVVMTVAIGLSYRTLAPAPEPDRPAP